MAHLRLVIACIAVFTLAFLLQIKHVQAADHTHIYNQLPTIETAFLWNLRTSLNITCNAARSDAAKIEKIYKSNHISTVHIIRCPTPRDSYVDLLNALGVNVAEIEELSLLGVPEQAVLRANHFAALPIKILNLYGPHDSPLLRPDEGFLDLLTELRHLSVVNVELPPLPESTKLEVVNLRSGSSVGDFGGCSYLKFLTLKQWEVPVRSNAAPWLAHCPELASVRLVDLPAHMPFRIITGANRLFNLAVVNCSVTELTKELLSSAKDLNQLHLPHNNMVSIARDAFELQKSLKELNLAHNDLNGETLDVVHSLPSLLVLSVSHNHRLDDFCDHFRGNVQISDLSLSDSGITRLCFRDWTSLVLFNLTNNKIATLEFEELPLAVSRGRALEVSLRGNPVTNVVFPESLYRKLTELRETSSSQRESPRRVEPFVRVSIEATLPCTCEQFWLARAIRDRLVEVRSIHCDDEKRTSLASHTFTCHDSGHIDNQESETDRNDHENEHVIHALTSPAGSHHGHEYFDCGGCQCHGKPEDSAVIANCASGTISSIPRVKGLKELYAAGNSIETFNAADLPDSLTMLDIRDNKVSHLSEAAVRALSAAPRRMRLAGNPIACDCDNVPFLAKVLNDDLQILDFRDLECANSDRRVRSVEIDELCKDSQSTDNSEDPPPARDRAALRAVAGVATVAFAIVTAVVI